MKTKTSFVVAIASLLALGGSAMAASYHQNAKSGWSAAREHRLYDERAQLPFDAYASSPNALPGRSDVSASEPGFNPALDRAKGGL